MSSYFRIWDFWFSKAGLRVQQECTAVQCTLHTARQPRSQLTALQDGRLGGDPVREAGAGLGHPPCPRRWEPTDIRQNCVSDDQSSTASAKDL